jgi:hypothetical protein
MSYFTLIYKEVMDDGIIKSIEPIELDPDEQSALKFAKLYQLQLPADLKKTVNFKTHKVRVG